MFCTRSPDKERGRDICMKNKDKKSIVTQTVLRVSFIFTAALLTLALVFLLFITIYMRDGILESQRAQMDTVTDTLDAHFNSLTELAISMSEYTPVTRAVTEYYQPYSAQWMDNIRMIDAYLQNIRMFTDYIVDVNLLDAEKETVYSMKDLLRNDYDYGGQEWFREALAQERLVKYVPPHGSGHLFKSSAARPSFTLIYPIERSTETIGYILIECDLLRMADFLQNTENNSNYILLDAQGRAIYQQQKEEIGGRALAELEKETEGSFRENGNYYIVRKMEASSWILVLRSDEEIILLPIRNLFTAVVLLGGAVAVLLLGTIVYHTKKMEKPFEALLSRIASYDGSAARKITEYNEAPRELAVIGKKFEEMADKMSGLIQDVYVAQLKEKEAQLEALTNQINPHFLYNVFQLIQTKAVLADNRDIEEMIQALSQMMRYAMERKRERVMISEELDYIRNYLMFYKVRFPQLFDYELECPEQLLSCRVLKFILQPVVENSFKHAFSGQKSGGIIQIRVEESGEDIIFYIRDNGKGMTAKRLRQVQENLEKASGEAGIGIVNTRERIRLVYGCDCGLWIDSREKEYTLVTIKIKMEGFD